ncbi:MAG: hypothetical protein AAFX05_05390 [Planctomycetota bacterium]
MTALGFLFIAAIWNGFFLFLGIGVSGSGVTRQTQVMLWLGIAPFLVAGAGMLVLFVNALLGRCEVHIDVAEGEVITGLGPFVRRRAFDAADVRRVRVGRTKWWHGGVPCVVIKGQREQRLGASLLKKSRAWMAGVLGELLVLEEGRQ